MKKTFDKWGTCLKKIPLRGLLCLFMICFGLQSFAQKQTGDVNINVTDASVKEVLEIIKKHDYRLVYSSAVVDACTKKITMNKKKATVEEILSEALKDTDLAYKVDGRLVTIKKVEKDNTLVIKGVVRDEKGNPIPGVSVLIKGTTLGTATGVDGDFELKVAKNTALLFSFVGMEAQTVFVESEQPLNITMKEMVNEMDEVVITGFQVLKKRESASSIYSLKAEDIIEPVGTSLDQMLQGKVPGMSVMQMTSTVGAAPKIRIRGSSTIMGSREPVWVLDGVVLEDPVQIDPADLNNMDKVNLIGNAISGLNPEDIERIDVLKDASATALYGTKAANGVIVITTKRGKKGKPAVRYSLSMNFLERPNYNQMFLMNSKERIEVSEEMHERGLQFSGYSPKSVGYEGALQRLWNSEISLSEFNAEVKRLKEMNTDWYKILFRNSFSHSHTVSISGGTDNATYYFSAGYSNQQGAPLQESSERFSFMSNLTFNLSQRLSVAAQLSANVTTTNRPMEDLYTYAGTTSRAIPVYNADGTYAFYENKAGVGELQVPLTFNILNELDNTSSEDESRGIMTNLSFNYKASRWLSLSMILSYNTSVTNMEEYTGEKSFAASEYRGLPYGYDLNLLTTRQLNYYKKDACELPYGGILSTNMTRMNSFMARPSFSWITSIGEVHSISGSAGLDIQSVRAKGYAREDWGYLPERGKKFAVLENLTDWEAASEKLQSLVPVITDNVKNTISYYATAAYSYMGKYVFSVNLRGDASNKLGDDRSARFKPVWSLAGRWNLTDENFMLPLQNVISNVGLRVSYGLQANVTDAHNPNMIISMGTIDTKSDEYRATLTSLPNHGLKWEKTRSVNVGIDFDLFKGALSGSFEYYDKKSKDQLLSVEVTSTNGGKNVTINGGDLTNKGWDLSLVASPIKTKDFEWRLSFNTGKVKNQVNNAADQSLSYNEYLSGSIVKNGYALNTFYSYRFGGLNEKGYPTFLGVKGVDESGKTIISNRDEAFAAAFVESGKREPDLSGGLTTAFSYKGLSLSMSFTLQFGAKIRLNPLYEGDNFKLPYPQQNMSSDFVDRWKKPGDEAHTTIPVLTDELLTIFNQNPENTGSWLAEGSNYQEIASNYWQMYNYSDLRVVSGNFVRCRSLALNYSLPDKLTRMMLLKSVSCGLSVSNLFVIKGKGLKGRDPEYVGGGSNTIPPRPTYAFSLNVTF